MKPDCSPATGGCLQPRRALVEETARPSDGVGRSPNSDITSDFWVRDATYIRLKNLNISYSLPSSLLEGLGIQALQVNLSGSNLFTASKLGMFKKSIDPEAIGGVGRFYPPVKVIAIGINVTL